MEDCIYCPCVVFHIQPIAHVLPLTINGKRFAVTDVVDEERNELLRELVRAVVVRTVCHDSGHSKGIVEGTHKVV